GAERVVAAEPAATRAPSPGGTGSARPPVPAAPAGPTLLARGRFRSGAHTTTGLAAVLRQPAGQQVLTLTELDTSPGPDLRVYLARGDGSDVRGALDLGRLKGNKGTQQYVVPSTVDASGYGAVVVWCRAFSVAFGAATLVPAS